MINKEAGLKACRRTLQNTFHKNKIWFYKLKEKPALNPADIITRFGWAGDHMSIEQDERNMSHALRLYDKLHVLSQCTTASYNAQTEPRQCPDSARYSARYSAHWKNTMFW